MKIEWTRIGSVLKATEGGIAQSHLRTVAKMIGVKIRFTSSPFIGHYGVEIATKDKRKIKRMENAAF